MLISAGSEHVPEKQVNYNKYRLHMSSLEVSLARQEAEDGAGTNALGKSDIGKVLGWTSL